MKNIIKYGFRQNIFGKQILQVLTEQLEFVMVIGESKILYNWRDATREEADDLNCKLKKITNNVK